MDRRDARRLEQHERSLDGGATGALRLRRYCGSAQDDKGVSRTLRCGMKSQELRQAWIDFFVGKQHKLLPPATLVPHEMSTTLFTIAGMEQFVPVFLGEQPAPAPRVVTVQRCLRVAGAKSDIESVGRTGRHGTFLEMLGNFSFGDYYKREAIAWAWEFVTQVLRLDPAAACT